MPKGVVWRHEDIFKSAMGGGDLTQGGDHVSGPAELAERLPDNGITALAAPPLMHAAAHWLAFHQLFTGGKVVLLPLGRFDPAEVWETIAGRSVFNIVLVGDAMVKPLLDEPRGDPGTHQHRRALGRRLQRRAALAAHQGPAARAAARPDARRLARLVGDRRARCEGRAGRRDVQAERLHRRPRRGRPTGCRRAGGTGRVARRGHVPLRYHNDPEKSAATFVEVDGVRWALTGDEAMLESDGTVKLLGRGSQCINTGGEKVYPEEVEEPIKAHPPSTTRWSSASPTSGGASGSSPSYSPSPVRPSTWRRCSSTCAHPSPATRCRATSCSSDQIVRSPAGKADYRWAKEHAAGAVT